MGAALGAWSARKKSRHRARYRLEAPRVERVSNARSSIIPFIMTACGVNRYHAQHLPFCPMCFRPGGVSQPSSMACVGARPEIRGLLSSKSHLGETRSAFHETSNPLLKSIEARWLSLALPYRHDAPSCCTQSANASCVALHIAGTLRLPTRSSCCGNSSAIPARMPMPEATVDKDNL